MNRSLQEESQKLARSWMQHEAAWLRDYLVAGVEDPRINLQSILSRHFLVSAIFGGRFGALMSAEHRFSAAMNWLLGLSSGKIGPEEAELILFSLRRGSDNAEGIQIPHWLLKIFNGLSSEAVLVPNYIEQYLSSIARSPTQNAAPGQVLDTFASCWSKTLALEPLPPPASRLTVIEPACGSANDFRFLHQFGIGPFVDYTGLDLCRKNIENARAMFPGARFETGNVFEIASPDKAFDFCIVQDLFEHLSFEGLARAIAEICRVTRRGICIGFFQMDEVPEHVLRPMDEYHWNLLSMRRIKEAFAVHGFSARVIHIETFLRQTTGCDRAHNPDAYTFMLSVATQP
jgi:SAM-dependent methyltransferase